MYTVSEFIHFPEPTISFSLPYPDWCLLQESPLWHQLDKYLEECQNKDTQMTQQERAKILEDELTLSLFDQQFHF